MSNRYTERLGTLILLLVLMITGECCCAQNRCGQMNMRLDSWMSYLSDTCKVCKVSIPGTHDALSGEGFTDSKFVNDYTTQVAGLKEQLQGGIRYFDVRLLVVGKGAEAHLQTCHRTATIRLTFNDVLTQLTTFLSSHKLEFVIMKIQYDGDKVDDAEAVEWNQLMQKSLADHASLFARFRPDMRVADARGKIILISRSEYGEKSYGAYTNWTDEGREDVFDYDKTAERTLVLSTSKESIEAFKGRGTSGATCLYVQDYYNSIGDRMNQKLKALEDMYHSSEAVPYAENTWIINHVSGFGTPMMNSQGYTENASHTNALLLSLLKKNTRSVNLGIIAMDFACTDKAPQKIGSLRISQRNVMSRSLIQAIINNNFLPKK